MHNSNKPTSLRIYGDDAGFLDEYCTLTGLSKREAMSHIIRQFRDTYSPSDVKKLGRVNVTDEILKIRLHLQVLSKLMVQLNRNSLRASQLKVTQQAEQLRKAVSGAN